MREKFQNLFTIELNCTKFKSVIQKFKKSTKLEKNLRINLRNRKWKVLKKGNGFYELSFILDEDYIRYNTVQKSVREVF